ncbi:crustacyanin-A1 subunit-like [Leptidea sinapis]|uniref:crustacyanin-A1 subunit-like n=1 Tax=Leptidea sinapis TaxID=189913 RepID=UPI002146EC29|nr:crustacyanin-A1 subunit-like [Leptidea sinapis]
MYAFVVFAIFVVTAHGQITVPGVCDLTSSGINAIRIVNEELLSGAWYQLSRINNTLDIGDCVTTTNTIIITNNVFARGAADTRQVFNKTAIWKNATFTALPNGVYSYQYPEIALNTVYVATDYSGYALLYSCIQANMTHKNVYAWQLARSTQLTETQSRLLNAAISSVPDLNGVAWRAVGHQKENCQTGGAFTLLVSPVLLAALLWNMFINIA